MRTLSVIFLFAVLLMALRARAADAPEQNLEIKNHAFTPQELNVPANQKIKLIIKNDDATAVEFESDDLNREKVVPANGTITVYLDPLDPGAYQFYNDFNRDMTGKIIAKP